MFHPSASKKKPNPPHPPFVALAPPATSPPSMGARCGLAELLEWLCGGAASSHLAPILGGEVGHHDSEGRVRGILLITPRTSRRRRTGRFRLACCTRGG